jgi:hypothetical protein
MESLEDHQPDYHPSAQSALSRKGGSPLQHLRHNCFRNHFPVSVKHPGQFPWPRIVWLARWRDSAAQTVLFVGVVDRTGLSFSHSLLIPHSETFVQYFVLSPPAFLLPLQLP